MGTKDQENAEANKKGMSGSEKDERGSSCFMWFKECILPHPVFIECLSGSACVLQKQIVKEKEKEDIHTVMRRGCLTREKEWDMSRCYESLGFFTRKRSSEWWMEGMEWESSENILFHSSVRCSSHFLEERETSISTQIPSHFVPTTDTLFLFLYIVLRSYSASNWLPAFSFLSWTALAPHFACASPSRRPPFAWPAVAFILHDAHKWIPTSLAMLVGENRCVLACGCACSTV